MKLDSDSTYIHVNSTGTLVYTLVDPFNCDSAPLTLQVRNETAVYLLRCFSSKMLLMAL